MSKNKSALWQGRGYIEEIFGGAPALLVGNAPEFELQEMAAVVVALFTTDASARIIELSGNGYSRCVVEDGKALFPQALADWPQVTHFSYGRTEEEIASNITEIYPHSRRWPMAGKSVVITLHPTPKC